MDLYIRVIGIEILKQGMVFISTILDKNFRDIGCKIEDMVTANCN
jgi:hypothetical protein